MLSSARSGGPAEAIFLACCDIRFVVRILISGPTYRPRSRMSDATDLRKSGIEVVGDVPWGTHFCQFYNTDDDLLEMLVPYFKAGLESDEACLWIVSSQIAEHARTALKQALPQLDRYLAEQRFEIFGANDWYMSDR